MDGIVEWFEFRFFKFSGLDTPRFFLIYISISIRLRLDSMGLLLLFLLLALALLVKSDNFLNGRRPQVLARSENRKNLQSNHLISPSSSSAAVNLRKLQVTAIAKQASAYSIGILFAALIWRSITIFELVSEMQKGQLRRLIVLIPSIVMIILNIAGLVLFAIQPNDYKNLLKLFLAVNVLREWIDSFVCICRILFGGEAIVTRSSVYSIGTVVKKVPREVYFGRLFVNVWWLTLCGLDPSPFKFGTRT